MTQFNGRSAFITGGGKGIGAATAVRFAEQGARVAIADVDTAAGQAVAERIIAAGGEAFFVRCDVSAEADVRAAMQRIVRWKIAPAAAIDPQEQYQVQLRFRLDLSQLPRPLQIGALGRSGWNLSLARSLRWSPEPTQ